MQFLIHVLYSAFRGVAGRSSACFGNRSTLLNSGRPDQFCVSGATGRRERLKPSLFPVRIRGDAPNSQPSRCHSWHVAGIWSASASVPCDKTGAKFLSLPRSLQSFTTSCLSIELARTLNVLNYF